jgi:putative ABC transport system substrate-binding protein
VTERRTFLEVLAGGLLASPLAAKAQQAEKVYQIGILTLAAAAQGPTAYWQPFIDELRELNYVPGRNVVIRYSGADARPERLPGLVAEMVRARVDVIVTTAVQETRAAKAATSSIPIVMTLVTDPVGQGLVASLARPGGNVTGLTTLVPGLYQKYVEFLHEVVPAATQFAVVVAADPAPQQRQELEETGRTLGVKLVVLHVSGPKEFESTLVRARKEGAAGIILTADVVTQMHSRAFVQLALKHRLPGVYWARQYVDDGGLMSYSANYTELRRHAATYVDKILKGAKPGDLPIEQPTKFELVINLKTAKAIGLTVPQSLLLRADQVIE